MTEKSLPFHGHNLKIYVRDDADESVLAEIFKWREYRAADNIIKNAKKNIIDIGAHTGLFTIYCRALNAEVKITSLEPDISNFNLLKKHLQKNHLNQIKTINAALAKKSEIRNLEIAESSHNHRLVATSEGYIGTRQIVPVPSVSLKDLCYKEEIAIIDLLKMDIEGGEYEIIDNLDQNTTAIIKNIIFEYHDLDKEKNHQIIEQKIRKGGFGVQRFPSHFDKKMGFILANNKTYRQK